MSISSVSNSYATQPSYGVKSAYSSSGTAQADITTPTSSVSGSSTGNNTSPGSIDFTSMTPNDFGKLINSGKITGGSMLLMSLPQGIGTNSATTSSQSSYDNANTKFDYIQRYTDAINSNKKMGLSTIGLENILNQMKALQGEDYPAQSTVDSYA